MKVTALLGERFKDAPSDCTIESHKLMVRGGYMKNVASGIYSLFAPAKRISKKFKRVYKFHNHSKILTQMNTDGRR